MHQCIKVVLRGWVHLPMPKDRLRLRIMLSYSFSSLLTFFSSSSLRGFSLLNGDNFRMLLIYHVFPLFCYSLNTLFDCLMYLLSYYIAQTCICPFGVSLLPPEKHIHAAVLPLLLHNVLSARTLNRNGELVWFVQQPPRVKRAVGTGQKRHCMSSPCGSRC